MRRYNNPRSWVKISSTVPTRKSKFFWPTAKHVKTALAAPVTASINQPTNPPRSGVSVPRGYLIASCQPSAFPENGARNAEFLSHTREDVPALIAEVRRLQSENARQALLLGEASATVRCDECGEHASLVLVKQCFYCNPPEEAE